MRSSFDAQEGQRESDLLINRRNSAANLSLFKSRPFRNVFFLSLSFIFVFMAFSSAQNYQTSKSSKSCGGGGDDNGGEAAEVGTNALAVLYLVFTCSTLFSSAIVRTLGPRISLFIGSATYVLFVSSNIIKSVYWYTYMSAALEGIGAAILWTAQGAFVTNSVTEYEEQNKLPSGTAQGTFNGLFFALFSVNQFIGNLLVAVLFQFQVSERLTFIVSTAICACGSVSMLFLRTPEAAVSTDVDAKEKPEKSLWSNISMLVDPTFILLVPVIIYNGLSQGYIFGALPDLVSQCSSKFYVMSVFGAVDAIASYSIGRISDRVGKRPFLFIGTVVHSFTYLAIFFKLFDSDSFYFVCAVLLGIGDAVWQTQAYAIVGTFFENNATAAFANFKLFQAGSTAVSFFLYKVISKSYQAIICVSMLGLGILALTVLNFKYRSIDLKRRVTFSKSDMDE